MNELAPSAVGGYLGLVHNAGTEKEIPTPFSRDIFLFDSYVAGTSHVPGLEALEPFLRRGDRLTFVRVPTNDVDPNAIKIFNADGVKLGYVPQKDNVVFARLMDAGKLLYGEISDKHWKGNWLVIEIRIYLHED